MTVGQAALIHPSLAGLVEAIQGKISRIALHGRFTRQAAEFLLSCLGLTLDHSARSAGITPAALRAFPRVHIFDSSSWNIDPDLKSVFKGCGGPGASGAGCKLQAGYEFKTGTLGFFSVSKGAQPDQTHGKNLVPFVGKGELMLIDLGYFKLDTFEALTQKNAYFLSRFLVGTTLWDANTLKKIDLERLLRNLDGKHLEMTVIMGKNNTRLPCRLIALRASEQVANARRRKLKAKAKEKGRTPGQTILRLCAWTLFVTNAPAHRLPVETIRSLYRLRWQIELVFKQLKSILRLQVSHTAKEYRLRCELYGKLIMATLIHSLHSSLNAEQWKATKQEVSFDKLYKRIQERAFTLLCNMLRSVGPALRQFCREIKRIARSCIKTRQPSRQTTLELLENSVSFS